MLKEFCKLVNMPFIEMDMYEADDIIGSLSCNAKDYNLNPYAVTGDKDIYQLIHKGIDILYLSNNGPVIYGEKEFESEYKIKANQFIDYKALVGDPSDNIPGVPGVGKKTAAKLLGIYDTLDGIYENVEDLKGKQRENIIKNKDIAYLSKKLSKIECNMELDYDKYFKEFIDYGFDLNNNKARRYLESLEIDRY